ncbi:hypothetical protein C0J52_05211 [Blattella germanica]|nr:hypothetical protein C0J52_05211 [Blattella germanica]
MIGRSFCHTDVTDVPALSRKLRYVLFPDLSTMGLYLAVATPLEDSTYDVSMSFNFEANYPLPANYTELAIPFVVSTAARTERQISRRYTYRVIEEKLHSYGLDGRECLLKTICDTANSILIHNGLLGEILHIILT